MGALVRTLAWCLARLVPAAFLPGFSTLVLVLEMENNLHILDKFVKATKQPNTFGLTYTPLPIHNTCTAAALTVAVLSASLVFFPSTCSVF